MYNRDILNIRPLGFHWKVRDPYLFCAHHNDHYPRANKNLGPEDSLAGRNLGHDFAEENPWRMYHGEIVPGFPAHPHRGFETITIVLDGFVDHSDSHGASGRYGNGDVQWMTAGSGLQHAEMFPLLNRNTPNPLKLFQVWLNLPADKKLCQPFYKMLWSEDIPNLQEKDTHGKIINIHLIAGSYGATSALSPTPDSWAANLENEVAIWRIKLSPYSTWSLPPSTQPVNRSLYYYSGNSLSLSGFNIPNNHSVDLLSDEPVVMNNGDSVSELLLLQGVPIGEPVVQYGPFVMNTQNEIRQALSDFRSTQFGGWPWPRQDNVHSEKTGRFARYSNGLEEFPN